MYDVYTLENKESNHYIGCTADLPKRIKGNNSSKSRLTKKKGSSHLVYKKEFQTKEEAFLRERQIKKFKGGEVFRILLV
jgi:putative endonuclease